MGQEETPEEVLEIDIESVEALEAQFAAFLNEQTSDNSEEKTPVIVDLTKLDTWKSRGVDITENFNYNENLVKITFTFLCANSEILVFREKDSAIEPTKYFLKSLSEIKIETKGQTKVILEKDLPAFFNKYKKGFYWQKPVNVNLSRRNVSGKHTTTFITNEIVDTFKSFYFFNEEIIEICKNFSDSIVNPLDIVRKDLEESLNLYFGDNYEIICQGSSLTSIIHFEELKITNNKQDQIIKDLFVTFTINDNFKLNGWLRGRRTTFTAAEFRAEYSHSHLQRCGKRTWGDFCTGGSDTEMSTVLADMQIAGGKEHLNKMLITLIGYLGWESISGGPYVPMDNINQYKLGEINTTTKNESSITVFSNYRFFRFVKYAIKNSNILDAVKLFPNSKDLVKFNDSLAREILGDFICRLNADSNLTPVVRIYTGGSNDIALSLKYPNNEEIPISFSTLETNLHNSNLNTSIDFDTFTFKGNIFREAKIVEEETNLENTKFIMEDRAYKHFKTFFKNYLIKNYNEYIKLNYKHSS